MKKIKFIVAAMIMAALVSCKPSPQEAANYNDSLMQQQKALIIKYDELLKTFDTCIPSKMDAALFDLKDQIEWSKVEIENIVPINGGEDLRQELLNYVDFFGNIANDEFEFLVRVYKARENELSPEMRIQWAAKYKEIDTKIKDANKHLKEVQSVFANNYNLNIAK
jgi:hypothetical protein